MGNITKTKINLSIAPTYLCNMDCSFCYLSRDERSDARRLDLALMEEKFRQVEEHGNINHIDIYGGEIALLPINYQRELLRRVKKHTKSINIITNFLKTNTAFMEDPEVDISVSYDFAAREKSEEVFQNMMRSNRDLHILTLATPTLMSYEPEYIVGMFNMLGNVKTVEIKPYSTNQCNTLEVDNKRYEDFIYKITQLDKKFEFSNERLINDCLSKKYNAYSDDHLYITPVGEFAVLDFDKEDNEYFKVMESFSDYKDWCFSEKIKVHFHELCGSCDYKGHCLTEHYRESCSGFPGLLDKFSK